jgi:hypothetical protein
MDELLNTDAKDWGALEDDGFNEVDLVCGASDHGSARPPAPCTVFAWFYRRGQPVDERYGLSCEAHALDLINARALREEPILV